MEDIIVKKLKVQAICNIVYDYSKYTLILHKIIPLLKKLWKLQKIPNKFKRRKYLGAFAKVLCGHYYNDIQLGCSSKRKHPTVTKCYYHKKDCFECNPVIPLGDIPEYMQFYDDETILLIMEQVKPV